MNSRPDDHTITQRKVRKGTHSCSECRRRKVKCVFSTPDSTTCAVCLRRGSRCFSQADSPVPTIVSGVSVGAEADAILLLNHDAPPKTLSATSADQNQRVAAGAAIDGISSLMPRRHASAEVEQESQARNFTATLAMPTSARFDACQMGSGNTQNAFSQAAAMPNRPMMPNDVSPPFPPASFDDLIMDTLLRESAPDEDGTKSWGISIFP
jgi:hypothetical protein